MRKVRCTVPKLNNQGENLSQQWFVYYRFWNEKTQRYQQIRVYKGFAEKRTKAAKYRHAEKLIEQLTFELKNGMDPIAEKEKDYIFYDEIEYSNKTNLGGRNKRSNKTVNYFANKYLASISPEIKESSYTTFQSKLRIFIYWLNEKKLGKADISAISPKIVAEFFDYLTHTRKIGNSRILYKQQLKDMFNYVIKCKYIKLNPVDGIEIKKRAAKPPRFFPEESLDKIKKYFLENDPQMWLAARLIFYCYIRPKELRFLKIGDILINEGTIHIRAEIAKTGRERWPVIPEHFRNELIIEGVLDYPEEYFIISTKNTPNKKGVSKNYLWEHFDKMRTDLKIQRDYKFYGFKHTGMVMSKKNGVDTKDIQMQAGHKSLDQNDQYISQMMPVESNHIRYNGPKI